LIRSELVIYSKDKEEEEQQQQWEG